MPPLPTARDRMVEGRAGRPTRSNISTPSNIEIINENIAKKKKERDAYIDEVKEMLKKRLEQFELKAEVSGRAKRLYSIYRKMVQEGLNIDEIYDITAFRVIVDTVQECYEALGYIHAFFKPIPGKFKDYIALPKANMYQSLHTRSWGHTARRSRYRSGPLRCTSRRRGYRSALEI